ncbi:MAG: 6-phospho-beta-glucosidase [Clostridia bacterium]|nr:6-phospho-beta-glucosidase [Clostridia bacterium]
MKLVVIGAGSTYTPELVDGLLRRHQRFPATELVLMDIDERKLRIVGALAERMADHIKSKLTIRKTVDLPDALTGADYVFAQIRVGKLPARHLDESIPLQYDLIGQETTGIGGFFKGLRTIPVILDIARHMEALCPDAWLINFSNPSGMISEALNRHSSIRSVGLCNGPLGMYASARKAVGDENAVIEAVGLNHLLWLTSVKSGGEEKLPDLLRQGYSGDKPANIPKSEFAPECLQAAGGIPTGYLLYYYERDRRLGELQAAEKTRAQQCMDIEEELLTLYGNEELYEKPALLDKRGGHLYSEAAVSLADALYNDSGTIHTVNVQNGGSLPYLARDDVAELQCRVGRNGIKPVPITCTGTPHMIGLIQAVKAYEKLAVQAAISGDRSAAFAALMVHPLVGDFSKARACFEELLLAHKEYLPKFF